MVSATTAPPDAPRTAHLIVVSGMSGAGKTVALRALEDLDYYCVDNLPTALIPAFVAASATTRQPRLAVGIDVRNSREDLQRMPAILADLARQGIGHELLFLDARDEALLKRYADTRRRHPLSTDGQPLADAIALERRQLLSVAAIADRTIDTSAINVHQLRHRIAAEFGMAGEPPSLLFESFAYKHGVPADADFVFDARCLPNPHWDARVRPLSGRDADVRAWLEDKPEVGEYLRQIGDFLDVWLPRFETDGRSYLTVGVGCTGGRHRSVYLAERLAERFRATRGRVLSFHRELE